MKLSNLNIGKLTVRILALLAALAMSTAWQWWGAIPALLTLGFLAEMESWGSSLKRSRIVFAVGLFVLGFIAAAIAWGPIWLTLIVGVAFVIYSYLY